MEKSNLNGGKEVTIGDFFVPNSFSDNKAIFWKSAKYLYITEVNSTIIIKNESGKKMEMSAEFFKAIIDKNLLIRIEEEVLKAKLLLSN